MGYDPKTKQQALLTSGRTCNMDSPQSVEYVHRQTRKSQWEQLLEDSVLADSDPTTSVHQAKTIGDQKEYYATGSEYSGPHNELGWSGKGRYIFPHGVTYQGDFHDGCFHGSGTLIYPSGIKVIGTWHRGKLMQNRIMFSDGLPYEHSAWKYCAKPDRRFVLEIIQGIQPAGCSILTDKQPTRVIPPNQYDTGDGFFNPATGTISDSKNQDFVLRAPLMNECEWIIKHCRKADDEPVGLRTDLYEHWFDCRDGVSHNYASFPFPSRTRPSSPLPEKPRGAHKRRSCNSKQLEEAWQPISEELCPFLADLK